MKDRVRYSATLPRNYEASLLGVVVEGVQGLVRGHVPELHELVVGPGGHQGSVIVEACAAHPVAVPNQRAGELAGRKRPYLHRIIWFVFVRAASCMKEHNEAVKYLSGLIV